MKREIKLNDILCYLQGNIRYFFYYNKVLRKLIPLHVREQIDMRIKVSNPACIDRGTCIKCGCMVTQLQMCNNSCEGNCYPPMMNKKDWKLYKETIKW